MNWKFWHHPGEVDLAASMAALDESKKAVSESIRKDEEAQVVTSRLRSIREENHFVEQFELVLGRKR